MLNVANVQILLVPKFNFQWDKVDGKLIIGNINHITRRRSDAMKPNAKGAQRRMFCCAPFLLSLRRVWVDGALEEVVFTVVQAVFNYLDDSKKSITFICLMPL